MLPPILNSSNFTNTCAPFLVKQLLILTNGAFPMALLALSNIFYTLYIFSKTHFNKDGFLFG
jgi:hypothetical protein